MSSLQKGNAIRRILNDLKDIESSNLSKEYGIHYEYNSKNIFNIRFLIIGPEDTPYQNGFFFFDVTFPDDYPFSPPSVKYKTNGYGTRFNPNLYRNGKVCLSILNTWDGPGWSPCNTISTVMLSILGLVLTKEPIRNEPGFGDCKQNTSDVYNAIIEHETLRVGVIDMILRPPYGFKYFKKIIMKHLIKNKDWYIDRCRVLDEKYRNKSLKFSLYNMSINCDYNKILENINDIIEKNPRKKRKTDIISENIELSNIKTKNICKGHYKNGNKCMYKAQMGKEYCKYHDN